MNLRIKRQEANIITPTAGILVTRTFEVRVEEVNETRASRGGYGATMDLQVVRNDVFFWDAGFGWNLLFLLYRHANGELGVRLVPS